MRGHKKNNFSGQNMKSLISLHSYGKVTKKAPVPKQRRQEVVNNSYRNKKDSFSKNIRHQVELERPVSPQNPNSYYISKRPADVSKSKKPKKSKSMTSRVRKEEKSFDCLKKYSR